MRGHEGEGSNEAVRLCKRHLGKRTFHLYICRVYVAYRKVCGNSRSAFLANKGK